MPEILPKTTLLLLGVFVFIEWLGREEQFALAKLGLGNSKYLRYSFYFLIVFCIYIFAGKEQKFIYFEF